MAAIIISIISLTFTIALTIWQTINSIKLNSINLKSTVYEKIFDRYLIERIPRERGFLTYDKQGKLYISNFQEMLHDLLNDSLFFKYADEEFYKKETEIIHNLEDLLVTSAGKKADGNTQAEIMNEINKYIKQLYKLIQKKRING